MKPFLYICEVNGVADIGFHFCHICRKKELYLTIDNLEQEANNILAKNI